MKSILILIMLILSPAAIANSWSPWKTYDKVTEGRQDVLLIEFRTYSHKNWGPKAQWRVTNLSNSTLYGVGIGNKTYKTNIRTKGAGAEGNQSLAAGDTKTFASDQISSTEGEFVRSVILHYVKLGDTPGEIHKIRMD